MEMSYLESPGPTLKNSSYELGARIHMRVREFVRTRGDLCPSSFPSTSVSCYGTGSGGE